MLDRSLICDRDQQSEWRTNQDRLVVAWGGEMNPTVSRLRRRKKASYCLHNQVNYWTHHLKFIYFILIRLSASWHSQHCAAASGLKLSSIGDIGHVGNIRAFFRWHRTSSLLYSLMTHYLPVHYSDLGLPGVWAHWCAVTTQTHPLFWSCSYFLCRALLPCWKATV